MPCLSAVGIPVLQGGEDVNSTLLDDDADTKKSQTQKNRRSQWAAAPVFCGVAKGGLVGTDLKSVPGLSPV